jgi:DNA repair protein RAD57
MTDLTTVLPGFPTQKYVRLLPSLEKNLITTADLLTLDCVEIARRAQLPVLDVKRLSSEVLETLKCTYGLLDENNLSKDNNGEKNIVLKKTGEDVFNAWDTISSLDDDLDKALGGGIPSGYITEVAGERYICCTTLN